MMPRPRIARPTALLIAITLLVLVASVVFWSFLIQSQVFHAFFQLSPLAFVVVVGPMIFFLIAAPYAIVQSVWDIERSAREQRTRAAQEVAARADQARRSADQHHTQQLNQLRQQAAELRQLADAAEAKAKEMTQ